jgi:nucleotide-binding universal stress UspA family protein
MAEAYRLRSAKILVAVAFDERLDGMIHAAEIMSLRTGAPLQLVHICEPPVVVGSTEGRHDEGHTLLSALQEEKHQVATRRLQALARTMRQGIPVDCEAVIGEVVPALVSLCETRDIGLVMIGAARRDPAGLSTAVNLLTEVACPVMVLSDGVPLGCEQRPPRILLADDLSEASLSAVRFALGLACAIPGSQLTHLHVQSASEFELLRKVHPSSGDLLTWDQWRIARREAEAQVLTRAGNNAALLEEAGGRYLSEVLSGHVHDEIQRSALSMRADLIICGEHHVFHWPTMQAGQVPYRQMLAGIRPVIVVPQDL